MTSPVDQARAALPNLPDEVCRLWLEDRVRQNGWPPAGIEWEGFLFGQPLEFWKRLTWSKESVSFLPEDLGSKSLNIAEQMLETNLLGLRNILSDYIPNTLERFQSLREYIAQHARLPAPLILLRTPDGYEVVDGNHRVAAMLSLGTGKDGVRFFPKTFDAWVGR